MKTFLPHILYGCTAIFHILLSWNTIVNTVSILWNTILHPLLFPMVCGFFNVWQCYQQGLTDETSCLSSSSVRIYLTSLLKLLLGIAKGGFGSSWWIMQKIIMWKLENNILTGKKINSTAAMKSWSFIARLKCSTYWGEY